MTTISYFQSGNSSVGDMIQCGSCGTYYIGYHNCPYNTWPTSYPVYYNYPTDLTPVLEKLDELLKEIKKLNKKVSFK